MTRLAGLLARRAARIWLTAPLRAADSIQLWRSGDVEIALIVHRTTNR